MSGTSTSTRARALSETGVLAQSCLAQSCGKLNSFAAPTNGRIQRRPLQPDRGQFRRQKVDMAHNSGGNYIATRARTRPGLPTADPKCVKVREQKIVLSNVNCMCFLCKV